MQVRSDRPHHRDAVSGHYCLNSNRWVGSSQYIWVSFLIVCRSSLFTVADNLFSQRYITSDVVSVYFQPSSTGDPITGVLTFGGTSMYGIVGAVNYAFVTYRPHCAIGLADLPTWTALSRLPNHRLGIGELTKGSGMVHLRRSSRTAPVSSTPALP